MPRAAPLQMIPGQSPRTEQQQRQRLCETPVQVGQPLDPFPSQMGDGTVVIVGVLAAGVAIGAGQFGSAIGAGGARRPRVLGLAM